MTTKRPLWIGIGAVVVLAAGGIGFTVFQAEQAHRQRVEALLEANQALLSRQPFDRSEATALSTKIRQALSEQPSRELSRAAARLALSLGRTRQAWDEIAEFALDRQPAADDLALGAEIMEAIHAESADPAESGRALQLAMAHFELTGDRDSAFRAWRMAFRAGRIDRFSRLGAELVEQFGDSLEARIVRGTAKGLVVFLGIHRGVTPDLEEFRQLAERDGDGDVKIEVARAWVAADQAAAGADELERLQSVAAELDRVQPELDTIIAMQLLASDSSDDHAGGLALAKQVVRALPASVDARAAIVIGYQRLGDLSESDQRDRRAQLTWLLTNASETDTRRAAWQRLMN